MLFAIVDIETTGGHPNTHKITEIAINIHDGTDTLETYTTLINPEIGIPTHITALTGINNNMVLNAPKFRDVSSKIYQLLEGKIFVAHNVNFDYSFVKHQLDLCGHHLQAKKLCTVRLARKLIPGLPSYSLGRLCKSQQIQIVDRHRAKGDADATTILFKRLFDLDQTGEINSMIKKGSKEHALPPNLQKDQILNLPTQPGVYYFLNNKGKVIYVGKAVNIKKRVLSHFSGHSISQQRQAFLRDIHFVETTVCGTELMALILESIEIKRLWPENNRALKKYEYKFGIFDYVDQNGYVRLGIDKLNQRQQPIITFNSQLNAANFLSNLVATQQLCPRLSGTVKHRLHCENVNEQICACNLKTDDYNQLISNTLETIANEQPTFILMDKGRSDEEKSCLWVENGKFYGMGYLGNDDQLSSEALKLSLNPYPSNRYILSLILSYAERNPQKIHPIP